jgi:predicted protein tyrosine phosphatase
MISSFVTAVMRMVWPTLIHNLPFTRNLLSWGHYEPRWSCVYRFSVCEHNLSERTGELLVGRVPTEWVAKQMDLMGVKLVVGIIEEHERIVPKSFWGDELGMTYLEINTVDTQAPDSEDIAEAVRHIASTLARGDSVLVHCMFGHGRSAAVAAAAVSFMERDRSKMSVRDAVEWIKNNHRSCICPNSAQLFAAEQAVQKLLSQ